jgi:hypothetical protein
MGVPMSELGQRIMRANPGGRHAATVSRSEATARLLADLGESTGIEPVVVYAADLRAVLEVAREAASSS